MISRYDIAGNQIGSSVYAGDGDAMALGPDGYVYLNSFYNMPNLVTRHRADTLEFSNVVVTAANTDGAYGVLWGPDSNLWVASQQGVRRFNPQTGHFIHYRNDPNDPSTISNNFITSLSRDEKGALWVGTLDGLNRLDRQTDKFTRYANDPANASSLGGNSITAIFHDQQDQLWIGTNNAGM